jgi:phosphoglycolate phosphatase-like HAD superfamily hydrolase
MVRVFLSDLDGTLIDISDRLVHAHHEALHQFGHLIDIERLHSLSLAMLRTKQLLTSLNIRLSSIELSRYNKVVSEHFYNDWKHSTLFPGALEALESLRAVTPTMRLITSRRHIDTTRREVRRLGLYNLFETVFTRGDLALAEGVDTVPLLPFVPHRRRLIQLALQDLDHRGEVWVAGDTPGELKAAKDLGFTAIGVLSGFAEREDLEPFAHHILDSIAEIGSLI